MASLKIILLCILAAIVYGILHDQVTARVCVEYFTVGHVPIFHTESPTLLAFGWGTLATWWVGLILGIIAALVSRVGSRPKMDAASLIRPIACLLVVMAVASLLAGITGYQLAKSNHMVLSEPYGSRIPKDHHWGFFADSLAHLAAYMIGAFGGMILCVRVMVQRRRMASTGCGENACPARLANNQLGVAMSAIQFEPKWKELLICTMDGREFTITLTMGILTVYFPTKSSWEANAPDWAKQQWERVKEELSAWCLQQKIPLQIEDHAWVEFE